LKEVDWDMKERKSELKYLSMSDEEVEELIVKRLKSILSLLREIRDMLKRIGEIE